MENQHFAEQTPLEKMRWSALLIAFSLLWAGAADANGGIVTDGSLGRPSSVFSPGIGGPDQVIITQSAGQISGHNLFQSFSNFNINKGQTVTFTEDQKDFVDNVIARVTGNETSTINGTLRVTPAGHANFYLLNPNGVLFGNGAQIDVPGDFHVTTAHFIKFQDGAKYSADAVHSKLSAANPSAFGFTGSSKSNNVLIEVKDGAQLSNRNPQDGPSANTVDLVGQNIKVDGGGQVSANDVRLVATKGRGSVTLDKDRYGYLKLPTSMPTAATAGKVVIDGQDTAITSSSDGGGRVGVWGGKVEVTNNAGILSTQTGNHVPSVANGIYVNGSLIKLSNGGTISSGISSSALGNGANIYISSGHEGLEIYSGSSIASRNDRLHDYGNFGGNIKIKSNGGLTINGSGAELECVVNCYDGAVDQLVTPKPTGINSKGTGLGVGGSIDIDVSGAIKSINNGAISSHHAGNIDILGSSMVLSDNSSISVGSGSDHSNVSAITSGSSLNIYSNGGFSLLGSTMTNVSYEGLRSGRINILADSVYIDRYKGTASVISNTAGINPSIEIVSRDSSLVMGGSSIQAYTSSGAGSSIKLSNGGGLVIMGYGHGDGLVKSEIITYDSKFSTDLQKGGSIYINSEYILMKNSDIVSSTVSGGGYIGLNTDAVFAIDYAMNGDLYWNGETIPRYLFGGKGMYSSTPGDFITVENNGSGGNIVLSGSLLNLSGDMASLPPVNFTPKGVSNACDVSTKGNLGLSGKGGYKAGALDKAIFGY